MNIRRLAEGDIAHVLSVQKACYRPELIESDATFLRKMAMFPDGCWGAFHSVGLAGYVFGHPWVRGRPVPLNSSDYGLPQDPDCMYLHDLAVLPTMRGTGVAPLLVRRLAEVGVRMGVAAFALVAVQGSEAYWARWGFKAQSSFEYGLSVPASYMVCDGAPIWR